MNNMIYVGFDDDTEIIYRKKIKEYQEKWKWVKYNDKRTIYKISNHGKFKNTKTGKVYDFANRTERYYRMMVRIDDQRVDWSIHRLVAMYFCSIPKRYREKGLTFKDLVPNHKDGNKHHNAAFNLEWITQKENTEHAWREGLCDGIRGENTHLAKITEKQAILICELIMKKIRTKDIAKELDIPMNAVQHIRAGETWKHISKDYKFPKLTEAKHYTTPDSTIHKICQLLELKKYSAPEIAKMCGVKREYVKDIKTHRRRKDISSQYNF